MDADGDGDAVASGLGADFSCRRRFSARNIVLLTRSRRLYFAVKYLNSPGEKMEWRSREEEEEEAKVGAQADGDSVASTPAR